MPFLLTSFVHALFRIEFARARMDANKVQMMLHFVVVAPMKCSYRLTFILHLHHNTRIGIEFELIIVLVEQFFGEM